MKSLLIIGFVWPEPNSSAAGGRMMQLISLFQNQGFKVLFASPAQDSEYMVNLDLYDVERKGIALNCSSFDVFIKELNPSVVVFDRFMIEEQFGWRVAENCPNALRILDTEDLHCLRIARQKAFKKKSVFQTTDLLIEEVAKREIASILRCDMSLLVSEVEMDLLVDVFKVDNAILYYLPLLFATNALPDLIKLPSYENRKDFVFIGNFLHEPNWNAVLYLKETIWPLIKKQLPEAVLHIYGAYPSQKVLQLHQVKDGFLIHGRANNANEVVQQARVVLAPLRFGAGIKGKLLEAMLCGTPSVTTTIGAESMCGDLSWNGCVVDEAVSFCECAVRLYRDKQSWQQAQQHGVTILKERYLYAQFENEFSARMTFLMENLAAHRIANFMGELLHYHTLKSTKYMSKWIEEKKK
ncbi:glycosyltransferase [Flavobacterium sp. UMI-01]|uniref:glycosyltransferase n=1 Tax=Flavobacterium sp. UMI-01 TaxID=1441053 RepID=UPI001C7D16EA|nr:glycosyltransferase [Flavobacterium sp. UMI-01]GIZ10432.1 glycosyl transferase [Flavobacterium sp. UMI-01]